ncbi:uncharacterized protein LOC111032366 [Myzus persicae]|uniref:uncharacterized protein LOC111032366 n=1 Tax=Myzus persicae TaxID=13164 RepID=UPI000B9320A1|nr:uncharacterized protein LOC111032366 [Myzus persicae]
MNAKNNKLNFMRLGKSLESSLYPSLVRVLSEAHKADAISYNHKFQKIFMNRLAEDLWYNNPLYPERERTSVCSMPFAVVSNDLLQTSHTFSWGISRDQAATIIQVTYCIQFLVYKS